MVLSGYAFSITLQKWLSVTRASGRHRLISLEMPKHLWRDLFQAQRKDEENRGHQEDQRPGPQKSLDHRTPGGCIPTWLHQLWLPQWHQWDSWAQVWTTSVSDTVTDPQLLILCFSSFLVLTSNNFFSENGLWHFSFRFLLRLPLLLPQKNTKK